MKIECNHCNYTFTNEIAMNFNPDTSIIASFVGSKKAREICQCERFIQYDDTTIICPICNKLQPMPSGG
jgi:hypothetical protein